MRKYIKSLLLIIIMFFAFNVKASGIPYTWKINGVRYDEHAESFGDTVSIFKEGSTVTLILNNYNGGPLEIENYGSGYSCTFYINLKGNNVITTETGVGIETSIFAGTDHPIIFTGDGDLIINAPTPISYESNTEKMYINPSQSSAVDDTPKEEVITTDDEEKEEIVEEKSEEEESLDSDAVTTTGNSTNLNDDILFRYIPLVALALSVLLNLILLVKLNKSNKIRS